MVDKAPTEQEKFELKQREVERKERVVGLRERELKGIKPFAGFAPERKTELQKAEVARKKGIAKQAKAFGVIKQLEVAEKSVATAKTVGTFVLPAILIVGGLASLAVLWDWFATGYRWLWSLGILLVIIIILRRRGKI